MELDAETYAKFLQLFYINISSVKDENQVYIFPDAVCVELNISLELLRSWIYELVELHYISVLLYPAFNIPIEKREDMQVDHYVLITHPSLFTYIDTQMLKVKLKLLPARKPLVNKVSFGKNPPLLTYGTKECPIRENSLQYYICKLTFKKRSGPVNEDDIIEAYDNGESSRGVYNAIRHINKKTKSSLMLDEDLLTFKAGIVRINKIYQ